MSHSPVERGDRCRLRKPRTEQEIEDLPFGTSEIKIRWMDEKTVYTVRRVERHQRTNKTWKSSWRIYLYDVEDHVEWSFGEHWILPETNFVNEKVYNVLRGLPA